MSHNEAHKHYKATIDESRYIVACVNEPGKTMFWIHNGMGLTRIKLSDEAFLAMVNLFTKLQRDLVPMEVSVSRGDIWKPIASAPVGQWVTCRNENRRVFEAFRETPRSPWLDRCGLYRDPKEWVDASPD